MKGNLLLGTGRGKLGDVVARVLHGEQVFSKYQPVVFNPKSIAQSRQREMLSIATKKATVLNDLKTKGVELYYSNKFGASRNIRNLIVSISTRAQRIADAGHQGNLKIPYIATTSNIGNDFDLQLSQGQVALTDVLTSEKYAFGSDVPLDLNTKIGGFVTLNKELNGVFGDCSNINIFEADLVLTKETVSPECLSMPKTMGLIAGSTAVPPVVTGYPYVYSFNGGDWTDLADILTGSGTTGEGFKDGFMFVSWRDSKGNLLISKGSTKIKVG